MALTVGDAIIEVVVRPGSKKPGIERQPDGSYLIRVRERAREGAANAAVIKALAAEIGVAPTRLEIRQGAHGRRKLIRLLA